MVVGGLRRRAPQTQTQTYCALEEVGLALALGVLLRSVLAPASCPDVPEPASYPARSPDLDLDLLPTPAPARERRRAKTPSRVVVVGVFSPRRRCRGGERCGRVRARESGGRPTRGWVLTFSFSLGLGFSPALDFTFACFSCAFEIEVECKVSVGAGLGERCRSELGAPYG